MTDAEYASVAITLVCGLLVIGIGFVAMNQVAASDDFEEYVEDSAEWCEERGGDLYNARVIGSHGGLHCELPNGTHVHMSEVIDYGG